MMTITLHLAVPTHQGEGIAISAHQAEGLNQALIRTGLYLNSVPVLGK